MNGQQINLFIGILLEENVNRNYMKVERRRLRDEFNPFDQTNRHFKQMFRLDKNSMRFLINSLTPHVRMNNLGIPFEVKVFATLNFLATGSYQNVIGCNAWVGISQTSMSRAIFYVCGLIVQVLMRIWIKFPVTEEEKNIIKHGFYEKFNVRGTVGAIDGTHVEILAPPSTDENFPPFVYINRKGKFSINVMLISDANCKILACCARYPGSTHDSAIWQLSAIRNHLLNNFNEGDVSTRLIGDSGYPLEPWLFTPILNPQTQLEETFNERHIRARNVIERTNGVLKGRFRCLSKHRTLIYHPIRAANIIYTCCILHNMALQANVVLPEDEIEYAEEEIVNNYVPAQDGHHLLQQGRDLRRQYIQENIFN